MLISHLCRLLNFFFLFHLFFIYRCDFNFFLQNFVYVLFTSNLLPPFCHLPLPLVFNVVWFRLLWKATDSICSANKFDHFYLFNRIYLTLGNVFWTFIDILPIDMIGLLMIMISSSQFEAFLSSPWLYTLETCWDELFTNFNHSFYLFYPKKCFSWWLNPKSLIKVNHNYTPFNVFVLFLKRINWVYGLLITVPFIHSLLQVTWQLNLNQFLKSHCIDLWCQLLFLYFQLLKLLKLSVWSLRLCFESISLYFYSFLFANNIFYLVLEVFALFWPTIRDIWFLSISRTAAVFGLFPLPLLALLHPFISTHHCSTCSTSSNPD